MMIIAVGDGERIARVLPELGGLLRRPLVTLERVRVCKRDGELLASRNAAGTDERGLATVAEADGLHLGAGDARRADPSTSLCAGCARPAPRARLRCGGSGAFMAITPRTVTGCCRWAAACPSSRSIVDGRTDPRSFAVVDELTGEHGVVTSEIVPALSLAPDDTPRTGLNLARLRF